MDFNLTQILVATIPQFGTVGLLLYKAFSKMQERIENAEATADAVLEICAKLLEMHEDDNSKFSTVQITGILGSMVKRDKNQHAHNRWVQDALKLIVRRSGGAKVGDAEADALDLGRPPND